MPKYVKLTAKPNTWFKEGTEVFNYDQYGKRLTLEEYNNWVLDRLILVSGIRVCEDGYEVNDMGCKIGEERIDGESCNLNEFIVEIVDQEYS